MEEIIQWFGGKSAFIRRMALYSEQVSYKEVNDWIEADEIPAERGRIALIIDSITKGKYPPNITCPQIFRDMHII